MSGRGARASRPQSAAVAAGDRSGDRAKRPIAAAETAALLQAVTRELA
jgi:hypothetical protein